MEDLFVTAHHSTSTTWRGKALTQGTCLRIHGIRPCASAAGADSGVHCSRPFQEHSYIHLPCCTLRWQYGAHPRLVLRTFEATARQNACLSRVERKPASLASSEKKRSNGSGALTCNNTSNARISSERDKAAASSGCSGRQQCCRHTRIPCTVTEQDELGHLAATATQTCQTEASQTICGHGG